MSSNVNQDTEEGLVEWSVTGRGICGTDFVVASFLSSEELSSTIGVVVEALGSSVLVAISMLVISAYSDSESVEVWAVFKDATDSDVEEKESWA